MSSSSSSSPTPLLTTRARHLVGARPVRRSCWQGRDTGGDLVLVSVANSGKSKRAFLKAAAANIKDGATGNNGQGVVGVCQRGLKIIPAKFLGGSGGSDSTAGAVNALWYLLDLKNTYNLNMVATSNSWGGGGYSQSLYDAIKAHRQAGILFVAAAGNDAYNTDTTASYPSNYALDNVISVDPSHPLELSAASVIMALLLWTFLHLAAASCQPGPTRHTRRFQVKLRCHCQALMSPCTLCGRSKLCVRCCQALRSER